MTRVGQLFQMILRQVLFRRIPHAILSWRYLLPNQSEAVKLHRRVFVNAWPRLPRLLWLFIALYSYGLWFLFWGWFLLWKNWQNFSVELAQTQGISRARQLFDLIRLSFLHTTPARYYYRYQLYRYRSVEWFHFIYTHELPHWHLVLSPQLSDRTAHLMAHKADFATYMLHQGLPSVQGEVFFRHSTITESSLFQQSSLFLKPVSGSRKEGSYRLDYLPESDDYRLRLSLNREITHRNVIQAEVQNWVNQKEYLRQPLLVNHPLIASLSPTGELLTIRLVTLGQKNSQQSSPKILSAILEFPKEGEGNFVYPVPIDLITGQIQTAGVKKLAPNLPEALFTDLQSYSMPLPYWDSVCQIAVQAHQRFPDLLTIGWDLAITDQGVKLIEGNINWGVEVHQVLSPILLSHYTNQSILQEKRA